MIRWIFIEAQTVKTRLDNHYSFLNNKVQSYVEDKNKIIIKDDIVKATSFDGGIAGTTAVLVDTANIFCKRFLRKNKFKIRSGAQETHELFWQKDLVEVTNSSNVSVP